ncbi:carbohydrate ABC transporter permease (plasmid) [Rhodococcus erythropolis]|uniref:carbohydrate ABC transporter permease n=1 Tax=Rhodococcus erythropolis TaxID=1833 RepID=UPI00406BD6D6
MTTDTASPPTPTQTGARTEEPAEITPAKPWPRKLGRLTLHIVVVLFMIVWFTPVLGLFISSIRTKTANATSGWWEFVLNPVFTFYNYRQAFDVVGIGGSLSTSLAIAVPTTILTTLLATMGGYALAQRFKGRAVVYLLLIALLVVPPQVTLVPLLRAFEVVGINGTIPAVWLYQVGYTVPFGIFLVRGFIASIPQELFEAAQLDGASSLRIFRSIVIPISMPIMASLALMQFLWSWNDLLIPLIFLGGGDLSAPLTVQVAGLVQTTGEGESMLLAAAFISVALPLVLILSMQRFFVRGVLGGAVK